MRVSIGTFNLNNLFSRFNFQASIDALPGNGGGITLTFSDHRHFKARTFAGRLVQAKSAADTQAIAQRILAMDVDVLAVQEVEHIEVLKQFNRDYLGNLYSHIALVEGNDSRLIDIGVLSKLPFGAITSYQSAVHPDAPHERVFSRDLLAVEILNPQRNKKLFTLYNTHLKSQYVHVSQDQQQGIDNANRRRRQQAEMIAQIIAKAEHRNGAFVLTGDMNDGPDSAALQPMLTVEGNALVNALADAAETRPAKKESAGSGPQSPVWTYRHNPSGPTPPHFSLLDQIWLSDSLGRKLVSAHIDRRSKHGGDGSDHDPAWVVIDV